MPKVVAAFVGTELLQRGPQDFFGGLAGAIGDDDVGNSSGSAYTFERQGDGSWLEVDKLLASDGGDLDTFGQSVSLSGDFYIKRNDAISNVRSFSKKQG